MSLSFEYADDGENAVVVRMFCQSLLYFFNRGLAQLPDDFHDFELFIGKDFGWLSRHRSPLPGKTTNLYVHQNQTVTYLYVGVNKNLATLSELFRNVPGLGSCDLGRGCEKGLASVDP